MVQKTPESELMIKHPAGCFDGLAQAKEARNKALLNGEVQVRAGWNGWRYVAWGLVSQFVLQVAGVHIRKFTGRPLYSSNIQTYIKYGQVFVSSQILDQMHTIIILYYLNVSRAGQNKVVGMWQIQV